MAFAVIQTGGKQYVVEPKQKIKVEKLPQSEGEKVLFDKVLLYNDGKTVKIGQPFLKDVKVGGLIIGAGKKDKVTIFKYKRRKRYKVKRGHRQPYTEAEIQKF